MQYIKRHLLEAKDLSSFSKNDASMVRIGETNPVLDQITAKDDLVIAVHGTNTFWALWFCLYGVDADIEPPMKTLGRGNMQTGFSKIKDSGLFVSADYTSGFRTYVYFEVKSSELGISLEMAEGGFVEGQELYTLVVGDCIIDKWIPAKRINKIRDNNKEYSRKEFMATFPDPDKYISANYDSNTYSGTPLIMKYMKNDIYKEIKQMPVDDAIEAVNDSIKYNDYNTWGMTEEDMYQLLDILNKKKDGGL